MKKLSLILGMLSVMLVLGFSQVSAQTAKLTCKFSFLNVEEGYDHISKCKVFVDGELVGESSEAPETKANSVTVSMPAGKHTVRIENWALYEGNWEAHTIENNYSIDCLWEREINIKKKGTVTLVFDINSQTIAKMKIK